MKKPERGAQMGEGGSERPVGGGGGGGGEVAKCQRRHEWDIESISFMFNTHMDEESNWRCGGLFRQVTEHRRPQENPWKERQSVCMLTLCLDACVSKQVYGFICPLLSRVSLHLHVLSHRCPYHRNSSDFYNSTRQRCIFRIAPVKGSIYLLCHSFFSLYPLAWPRLFCRPLGEEAMAPWGC